MKDLNACFLIPRCTHRYTAARYWQYADKTRYVVYEIVPDVKILLMNDVKNTFFAVNSTKPHHDRSKINMTDMLRISVKSINK